MLRDRIGHDMAATDGKNQTALLDGAVRRIIDKARALLVDSGLGLEYWEFAWRMAVLIINHLPTKQHSLHHSAMRRWTGKSDPDFESRIRKFGCEAFPHLTQDKRPNKAKLDPVSSGGDGRWRYMLPGEAAGPGLREKGHILLDTKHGRTHTKVGVVFDERMEHVRALPQPANEWDLQRAEGVRPLLSEHERDGFVVVVDEDVAAQCEAEGADSGKPEPATQNGGADGDDDGVDERAADAGRDQVRPPQQPAKKAKKKKTTKKDKDKHGNSESDILKMPKTAEIRCLQVNPKKAGSKSYDRYEKYKHARTIQEFEDLGGKRADLKHDYGKGFIVVGAFTAAGAPWLQQSALVSRSAALEHEEWRQRCLAAYKAHEVRFFKTRRAPPDAPLSA